MALAIFRNFVAFFVLVLTIEINALYAAVPYFPDLESDLWNDWQSVDFDSDGESWDNEFQGFNVDDDYYNALSLIQRSALNRGDRNCKEVWSHKLCELKVETKPFAELFNTNDYIYKPHNVKNVTCAETTISDPFDYNGKNKEFCLIPQSPHENAPPKECTTKYENVTVFQQKLTSRRWEKSGKIKIGVGCECHIIIKS